MPARIFVGNLSFQTSADALTTLLSGAGQVVQVYLPTDRVTGRPRGFAFVEFSSDAEAAEAIRRFADHELDGRRLTLNAAEDRPPRSGPRPFAGLPDPAPGGSRFRSGDRPPRGQSVKRKGSRRGLRARKRSL